MQFLNQQNTLIFCKLQALADLKFILYEAKEKAHLLISK
jgi:hypothetical protein